MRNVFVRLKNRISRMCQPQCLLIDDTSPHNIVLTIPKPIWRDNIVAHIKKPLEVLISATFLGIFATIWATIAGGKEPLADVIVALLWFVIIWFGGGSLVYGIWLGFALGRAEQITLCLPENTLCIRKYCVATWLTFPGRGTHHTRHLRKSAIEMKAARTRWSMTVREPSLWLHIDGKRVSIGKELSLPEKERVYFTLRKYLVPHYDYSLITQVIFGHKEDVMTYTTLYNPDVSSLTIPMKRLTQIIIDLNDYDFYQVEQFLTYALNVMGQRYLQTSVDVHLYGEMEKLHSHLRNNLTNLCHKMILHKKLQRENGHKKSGILPE